MKYTIKYLNKDYDNLISYISSLNHRDVWADRPYYKMNLRTSRYLLQIVRNYYNGGPDSTDFVIIKYE